MPIAYLDKGFFETVWDILLFLPLPLTLGLCVSALLVIYLIARLSKKIGCRYVFFLVLFSVASSFIISFVVTIPMFELHLYYKNEAFNFGSPPEALDFFYNMSAKGWIQRAFYIGIVVKVAMLLIPIAIIVKLRSLDVEDIFDKLKNKIEKNMNNHPIRTIEQLVSLEKSKKQIINIIKGGKK